MESFDYMKYVRRTKQKVVFHQVHCTKYFIRVKTHPKKTKKSEIRM